MDAAVVAEQHAADARARELCSRAADARRAAEEACDRAAAVLIGIDGYPVGDRGERFLPRVASSRPTVRLVRHALRRWLERAGLPSEPVAEVILACSEACANAIEHARAASRQLVEIEATLEGGELALHVRDFGIWNEQAGSASRGRGLDIVRHLMDSLELQRSPHGTEIVMRRSFTPRV